MPACCPRLHGSPPSGADVPAQPASRERPAAAVAAELEAKLAGLLQPPVVNVTLTEVVEASDEHLNAIDDDDIEVPAAGNGVTH